MANSDSPSGLRPAMRADGSPYNGATRTYIKAAADAVAMFIGDPVKLSGTGSATAKYPEVAVATAGDTIVGVCVGFEFPVPRGTTYSPASTEAFPIVTNDPNLLFEVQEDSVGGALTADDIGLNIDLVFTHAGSTFTGLSGAELDSSTAATTATLGFALIAIVDKEDNALGNNAKWLVQPRTHATALNVAGV